jgi:sugar-specific transcriptional regulator TrmB
MNKFILLFERLGIPEKTARTYLDLLEHGTSSIAEICLRTGLHRPEAYRILPHLMELGLVKETVRGKRKSY